MPRRYQRNVTISKDQEEYARANYGKMTNAHLAKMLGIGYAKALNNLKVMGLYEPKGVSVTQLSFHFCKVINMIEYFDVDKFGKYYDY